MKMTGDFHKCYKFSKQKRFFQFFKHPVFSNVSNVSKPIDVSDVSNVSKPIDVSNVSNVSKPINVSNVSNVSKPIDG